MARDDADGPGLFGLFRAPALERRAVSPAQIVADGKDQVGRIGGKRKIAAAVLAAIEFFNRFGKECSRIFVDAFNGP